MAKPSGFWTDKRLTELEKLAKKYTPGELAKHFDRPVDAIHNALNFISNHKRLLISQTISGKVKHTVYAPGYATGSSCYCDEPDEDEGLTDENS